MSNLARWMGTGTFTLLAFAGPLGGRGSASDASSAAGAGIRFIVLGDSQLDHPDVFERMIHEVEMLRPDFVVQIGDMIHGYTYDEERLREEWRIFRAQLEPLTVPFYPVPGNHDVVTPQAEAVYGEVWGRGRYYYSFDAGPAHCIVLDCWRGGEDDRVAARQREWLAADLRSFAEGRDRRGDAPRTAESIFVFVHSPLWRYPVDHPGRADWEEVHALLRGYPVKMVAAGHTHEYVWEERDGIQYVVLNSSGEMPQNERGGLFFGYLQATVDPGGDARYAVIRAGSVLPIDTVDDRDRREIGPMTLKDGTIRVSRWEPGLPWEGDLPVAVPNPLDKSRRFLLSWRVPYGAEVTIRPENRWVEAPAGGEANVSFHLSTPSAPDADRMPWLEVRTEETVRTGAVSRSWEKRYRRRRANPSPGEYVPRIPLEAPVVFRARYDLFVPPVARAARRTGEIRIDGIFDEADWARAQEIRAFRGKDGSDPETETAVRFLYDDDAIYVAARMEEPNPAELVARAGPPIPLTWSDDDFELFFDPGTTRRKFFRLFQNAAGTRFNARPLGTPDRYFRSDYESSLRIGDDFWALEMRIPWSDLSLTEPPAQGSEWGLNLGRHRPRSREREMQWAGPLYDPTRYGILRFE